MQGSGGAVPDTLRCVSKGPTYEAYTNDRSNLALDWTPAGAVLCTVEGHGVPDLADVIAARWEKIARSSDHMQLLLDLGTMPTYDTAFRKTLTNWAVGHRKQLTRIELLSGSRLVTMGANVANIVLGGMVAVHENAASFDAMVRAAGLSCTRP